MGARYKQSSPLTNLEVAVSDVPSTISTKYHPYQLGISVVCLGIHRYIALPHRLHNFGFLACVSLLMYLKVSISARAARPPAYQEFENTCLVRGCDQWEHGGYGIFLDGVGKSTVVTHPSR